MAKKKDEGHEETERVLSDLEKRITKEYSQAEKEISAKLDDYLRRYEKKDEIKQKALQEGKITQQEYDQWKVGQIAVGKRWEEMRDTIAQDLTNTAEKAKSITNGYMPEVYAINHNYGTFQVEKLSKVDTSYTLYDRQSVERLFNDDNVFYKKPGWKKQKEINEGKQLAWDKKQVQSVMIQSLLQGESIGNIATRLANTVGDSDRKACIRNARTMTTGVENAGRIDSYKRAEDMGIKLQQEWLATLDGRTRHEHRMLDGQRVAVGDKFKIDGYEIAYPGDPAAEPEMVYNCRCTLVPALDGFEIDYTDTDLRNTNHMIEDSYDEWKESHNITSDSITKQDDIAETMQRAYGREYAELAGGKYTPLSMQEDSIKNYEQAKNEYEEQAEKLEKLQTEADKLLDEYTEAIGTDIEKELEEKYNSKYDEIESLKQIMKDLKAEVSGKEAIAVRTVEKNLANLTGMSLDNVSMTGMPYESAKVVYDSYKTVLNKYPELKNNIMRFSYDVNKTGAYASSETLQGRITAGKIFGNFGELVQTYADDVAQKYHPIGTDYTSIIVHELGHALDGYMTKSSMMGGTINQYGVIRSSYEVKKQVMAGLGWDANYLQNLRESYTKQGFTHREIFDKIKEDEKIFITEHVSEYAADSEKEFFAECFAEYMKSNAPREAAQLFGNIINGALGR